VVLPKLGAVKRGTKFLNERPILDHDRRPVVQASLGVNVAGIAPPHACPGDTDTLRAGITKRFAVEPPLADDVVMQLFREFVRKWLHKELTPLSPDADTSVPTWLDHCPYPKYRREELAAKHVSWEELVADKDRKYMTCSLFPKDETYPSYKHIRGINSRSDEFKCAVGPIFKLIEKVLFARPEFIKKIPVSERPAYIRTVLERAGAKYSASDYTSFESLFVRKLMDACEFQLYDYMTQYLPEHDRFMYLMKNVLGGINHCKNKMISVKLPATRMSGEMCTSLGNGFSNLMFLLFVSFYVDARNLGCVKAVIEGDDALADIPYGNVTPEDFAKLGLIIKLETFDELSDASFCGLMYDKNDLINIADPITAVTEFGWCTAKYKDAREHRRKLLLRCKSLSLAYQYPGCPIIAALARYGLRVTQHCDVRSYLRETGILSTYERENLIRDIAGKIPDIPVPKDTRLLMERLFGVSVGRQIEMENYFDSLSTIQELAVPGFDQFVHADVLDYSSRYLHYTKPTDRPPNVWPLRSDCPKEW